MPFIFKKLSMKQLTLMTRLFILFMVWSMALPFTATAQQCPTLVWSDEFDQTTLNTSDWNIDTGGGGFGNNELQNYTNRVDNLKLENGKLVITALKENFGGNAYTSAKITSAGKRFFTYGRMEAKIKLPKTQGLWPAFWMMPNTSVYGGWPRSGEIDIMEMKGSDVTTTYGTIHYGSNPVTDHRYIGGANSGTEDLSADFHIYAVEWKPDTISWYVDDVNFYNVTKTDIGTAAWPFDQNFFLIFNLAVGGNFGGNPNASTVFPQTLEVDYVRVYSNANSLHIDGAVKVIAGQTYTYSVSNGTATSYVWTVPAGATITSGQNTSAINVQWGTTGGDVAVGVTKGTCGTFDYHKIVGVIPNGCDVFFDDFESNRLMTYSTASTGINYSAPTPNTFMNAVNGSSQMASYTRNSFEQFDALKYDVNFLPTSVDYENGNNVLFMDLYTAAPVGSEVLWQFENKAKVSLMYPSGRRAVFRAYTTVQNQWERLKFTLINRPDLVTPATSIDQFAILFKPNTYTDDVYYIDRLMRRDKLNCGLTTSVEQALEQNFIVSPNPAHDRLDLTMRAMSSGKVEVVLLDVLGMERTRRAYEVASSSQLESIDISTLSPGLYVLYVKQGDATILSRKVIIQ
jgi:beta-glucanase (GH16 family)